MVRAEEPTNLIFLLLRLHLLRLHFLLLLVLPPHPPQNFCKETWALGRVSLSRLSLEENEPQPLVELNATHRLRILFGLGNGRGRGLSGMVGHRGRLNDKMTREQVETANKSAMGTHLGLGRLYRLNVFFGRVLSEGTLGKKYREHGGRRTGTETVSTFVSGEGSMTGVTSVDLSSEVERTTAVGSDIML